jgi:hypothetical protein
MAAQRRCRRFMGLALTSGPLLVAGVVWASPAQADAASYLNDMHNVGIQDFDGGDAALLQVGQNLCDEIWDGDPPAELAAMALQRSDTVRGAHGLTPNRPMNSFTMAKPICVQTSSWALSRKKASAGIATIWVCT